MANKKDLDERIIHGSLVISICLTGLGLLGTGLLALFGIIPKDYIWYSLIPLGVDISAIVTYCLFVGIYVGFQILFKGTYD